MFKRKKIIYTHISKFLKEFQMEITILSALKKNREKKTESYQRKKAQMNYYFKQE